MAVGDSKKVKLRKAMYQANMRKNRHRDKLYEATHERDRYKLALEKIVSLWSHSSSCPKDGPCVCGTVNAPVVRTALDALERQK